MGCLPEREVAQTAVTVVVLGILQQGGDGGVFQVVRLFLLGAQLPGEIYVETSGVIGFAVLLIGGKSLCTVGRRIVTGGDLGAPQRILLHVRLVRQIGDQLLDALIGGVKARVRAVELAVVGQLLHLLFQGLGKGIGQGIHIGFGHAVFLSQFLPRRVDAALDGAQRGIGAAGDLLHGVVLPEVEDRRLPQGGG